MIKLLIADDEEEIRKGIRHQINWKANGVEVCGEAEDGIQTLQTIAEQLPDIVLIDIRMPEMSGLEVAEAVRQQRRDVKFVILSGYDDFSFARQALKLGVSEYLLKPCLPGDILNTVLKLKSEIDGDRAEKERQLALQAQLEESLPLLHDKRIAEWLRGEPSPADELPESLASFAAVRRPGRLTVAIILADENEQGACESPVASASVGRTVRQAIAQEDLSGLGMRYRAVADGDAVILLATMEAEREETKLLRLLNELQARIRRGEGRTVSVGLGNPCDDAFGLRRSYAEAAQAADSRFIRGTGALIRYAELDAPTTHPPGYPSDDEKRLLAAVKSRQTAQLEPCLNGFFASLRPDAYARERVARCCMALMMSLYHLCLEARTDADDLFGPRLSAVDRMLRLQTLEQMKGVARHVVFAVSERLQGKKSGHKTIEQALRYIHDNYDKELTLEQISGPLFVNANYFCLLFKQRMGINFIDYVHKVRIEAACGHLRAFPYKTYEVASMVGYANEKYFCRIFKRLTGMTPTQYRDSAV